MKILFTNPPLYNAKGIFNRPIRFPTFNYASSVLHPPLLLAYAAAFIRSKGHHVKLVDAPALALGVPEFMTIIKNYSPRFVVIETSTPSFHNDIKVAKEIKLYTDSKVIFVGTHVSSQPLESMNNNCIDAIIMGEYEISLFEYIENGGKNTKGVCYRTINDEIIKNSQREKITNLDILPFPARDLLPNYKYYDPILKNPFTFVLGGRGCPYKCTFCNWPEFLTGHVYRPRTSKNIVDELEMLEREYNFKSFLFNDDTFTTSKTHVIQVCKEIIERGIKLSWACYSRADLTDIEILKNLRDAGCFLLKVGVESSNEKILKNVKKNYKIDIVIKSINLMKKFGFNVHCTFVFGLPGETHQTIEKTIEFAKKLDPSTVQFSTAIPYPGCEFYQYLKDNKYLLTDNWDEYMPMNKIFEYPNLSANEINNALKKAYKDYYFRTKYFKFGLKQFFIEPKILLSNFRRLLYLSLKNL